MSTWTSVHEWRSRISPPIVVVAAVATVITLLPVRGPDLSAHLFRTDLFREHGLVLWNGLWYGGHATPTYSLLFPPVASVIGATTVGLVSSVAAVAIFDRLVRTRFPAAASGASACFAVSVLFNLAIGRLTFALGLATGLGVILAWQRRRPWSAAALAVITPLASPVAAAFLAIAAGARAASGIVRRDRRTVAASLGILAATTLPVLSTVLVFPGVGQFPVAPTTLAIVLVISVAGVVLAPPTMLEVRAGAVLLGLSAIALAAVPNGMGGNIRRFVEIFGPALVVAVCWPARRRLAIAGTAALLVWASVFAFDVIDASGDQSVDEATYAALLDFLDAQHGPPTRVEIVFTEQHWETYFIGREYPIARGWERQTDIARNPLFYEDELDPTDYRLWLEDSAVRFVVLPAAELDPSGEAEAELLRNPPPWLVERWADQHWTVFEFVGWRPIVGAPARHVTVEPDSLRFFADRPATIAIRSHYTHHWRVVTGDACVHPDLDDLTIAQVHTPGWIELDIRLDPIPLGDGLCPPVDNG